MDIKPMYMPMEEEVRTYLVVFPSIIVLIALGIFLYGGFKYRNKVVTWFVLHIVAVAVGLYPLIGTLLGANFADGDMTAEDNSVRLVLAGFAWMVSMIFLLIGVFKLLRLKK